MNDDFIQKLWDKDESNIRINDSDLIGNQISHLLNNHNLVIKLLLIIYMGFIPVILIFNISNIFGYISNPSILFIQSAITGFLIVCTLVGLINLKTINKIIKSDEPVKEALNRRIKFFKYNLEIWSILVAILIVISVFTLNTFTDNFSGTYTINNPFKYIFIHFFIFCFIYVFIRLIRKPLLSEINAMLSDLDSQLLIEIPVALKSKTAWRKWGITIIISLIIITILVILNSDKL